MPNRLASETSPYLLQHAENPVDWYPWGDGGVRARPRGGQAGPRLDRLRRLPLVPRHGARVLRGPATSRALMNAHFVCVKVDREERPDVDAIYMDAVQAMTGQGGWPLNAFLTPDGVPFFGRHLLPAARRARACRRGREVLAGAARRVGDAARRRSTRRRADRCRGCRARRFWRRRTRRSTPAVLDAAVARLWRARSTARTAAGAARRSSRRRR